MADHEFTDFQQCSTSEYWHELMDGLGGRGHEVLHVLLDAAPETLHARIDSDPGGNDIRKWRHEHVEKFMIERPWLLASADLVVDTAATDADGAAAAVVNTVPAAT